MHMLTPPTIEIVGFPGLRLVKIQAGSLYPEKAKSSWERRNKKSPLIFGWAAFFTCQNVRPV